MRCVPELNNRPGGTDYMPTGDTVRDRIVTVGKADWPLAVKNPSFVKCNPCRRVGRFHDWCGDCNLLPVDKRYWIRPIKEGKCQS